MEKELTKLSGVLIITPDVFNDERGWFSETYNIEKYAALGIDTIFIQDNHSKSFPKGTLRGLHFQVNPHAQTKLVRCTKGSILDVAVDLRKNSETYLQWVAVELNEQNKKQLYIPQGFAHGFVTLEDNTEVQYKVDALYSKVSDRSIRYDDPSIGVDWGVEDVVLSLKDSEAPLLSELALDF